MRINKVKICGFYRIEEAELDLSKSGFYYVWGTNRDGGSKSNGAGKSSIFNAIEWCLYGRTARSGATAGDSVIMPKTKKGTKVELEIVNQESAVTITRKRKWGKNKESSLTIVRDGERDRIELSGKGTKDTTERIMNIVGVDYDTFARTYILPQQGIIPFGALADKHLKEFFIEKFLNLDWIDGCHKVALERLKEAEKKVLDTERDLESTKGHLLKVEAYLSDAIKYNDEWERDNKDKIRTYKDELKKLEKDKKSKEKAVKDKEKKLEEAVECLSGVTKDIVDAHKRHSQLVRKESSLESQAKHRDKLISGLERQKEKILERIEGQADMVGEQCDKCGNKIKKSNLDFLNEANKKELQETEDALLEAKERAQDNGSIDDVRVAIKEVEREIEDLEVERGRYASDKAKLSDTETILELIRVMSVNVKSLQSKIANEEQAISPYASQIEDYQSECVELRANIKELEGNIKRLRESFKGHQFWKHGFSPQGIQSYILDSVTPKLNDRIKEYLGVLSNGVLYAQFDTVTKLKSGEYREKFRLEAGSTYGASKYSSLSGGEQRRIDLAVALAIRDFKKEMSGKSLDLLVLDEPFAGLDAQGISDVISLLKNVFLDIPLYLVSHHDVETSVFDGGLVVEKEGGVSTVRVA